ncbi:MAG TPA: glycosyltransferase [Gammaproteobacteria bacterium]|nr:glycosyltransferase [Gammaproteobacteria bacterium]
MADILSLLPAFIAGLVIWLLPWRPWSTHERLDAAPPPEPPDLGDITVLIPARNEAAVIGRTLDALAAQGSNLSAIVIDDQSTDGTAATARRAGGLNLRVIAGQPLPPGWSGKLWALEQGRRLVQTPLILLLDADIALAPGTLATLRAHQRDRQLQLVSLMAHLGMVSFWEKLLLPAFVYFFKMLYPFALANGPGRRLAAAAGGCILIEARALNDLGGFAALQEALIDDCTLASRIKAAGGRTWVGLTHSARSLRRYIHLHVIWDMVARSAYTQLRYSPLLLALCALLMGGVYLLPAAMLLAGAHVTTAMLAFGLTASPYLPTLRYYQQSPLWALAMPGIAALFLAMTISSAWRYHRGVRSLWKDRIYGR